MEKETGKELLGKVYSTVTGVKAGVKAFGANLSLGMNNVLHQRYLMPYTFFTDATYTNSMITGVGNIDMGTAYKAMLLYNFNPQFWGKLSYSWFKFAGDKDTSESDVDAFYKFAGDFENLSIWFRVGRRNGKAAPSGLANLLEYRTQLQYTF
jgi:hypothetical protein